MSQPLLVTKLYIPPTRPDIVLRSRLIERLNEGLHCKLTLISAPAGFGKTTLVSQWITACDRPVAWLSLDDEDNDLTRFLMYFIAALQTLCLSKPEGVAVNIGKGIFNVLQSPEPPPTESLLTALINEITTLADNFVLVLDDYHVIDSKPVDEALTLLLKNLPPQMHLIIITREDPHLPLARLRARGQLTELRAADLRFTPSEAAEFLNQVMGLNLSEEDITALEARTEGWIAGLQLAGLSMQGRQDNTGFIEDFTGSHHFVLDYLMQEVLQQQSESIQTFLLRTSILDRLCGPLCDAVLDSPSSSGQETLEYLEHANLFIIPLDNERRWYRYHHLFADLLRQRLTQILTGENKLKTIAELHIRASQWFKNNDLALEAFQHAAAAKDIDRVMELISGDRIPQHFRGSVTVILNWLESLPKAELEARPWLIWRYASLLLVNGQSTGVEEKLQTAESALQNAKKDDKVKNLFGLIAATRATLALTRYDIKTMLAQSHRALEYLQADNLISRANANWTIGYAYLFQKKYGLARKALLKSIAISQVSGDTFTTILASIGLCNVQEAENQLHQAAETYQRILQLAGDQPLQIISEVHLGLTRVFYEWNDLDSAEQHVELSLQLAKQYESCIDRFVSCDVMLARIKLARGEVDLASKMLAKSEQDVRRNNFMQRMPEVIDAQVFVPLKQGDLARAQALIDKFELPVNQARVFLTMGSPSAAMEILAPYHQKAEKLGWKTEVLRVIILEAIVNQALSKNDESINQLNEVLTMAEPGGFIRSFVDEGPLMAQLLLKNFSNRNNPDYVHRILAAFSNPQSEKTAVSPIKNSESEWIESLSERELEVLRLIAEGLANQEIANRLYLSLHTIKVHARNIFNKLGVKNRTQAVARGKALGILT
jgi:LuxR family transcriptional regulator, maltose regulon positive regulatory protein